jgi:hypothetical protein
MICLLQVSNELCHNQLRSAPELPNVQPPPPKLKSNPVVLTEEEILGAQTEAASKQT